MLCAAAIFAAVLFAYRSTLLAAGVPDFRHDWRWPFLAGQIREFVPDVLRIWDASGLGAPRIQDVNHPAIWVMHVLALFLSSKALLCIGIVTTTFLTGLGVAVLARTLRVNATIATCVGIAAALSAPMFNKFVAGHWYYMISIAAVPWAIASAARYSGRNSARAVATGVLIALTALQPQLWVTAFAVCLVLFVVNAVRRDARWLLDMTLLIATAAVLLLPEMYAVLAVQPSAQFADLQTIPFWEANNSAAFWQAAIGFGYAPGYAVRGVAAISWAQAFLWIVPAAACLGAIVRRSERTVNVLTAAWLVSWGLVAGVKGPLAYPLQYLFGRYVWASAFRELYHFAAPMWIFALLLCAVALQRLRRPAGTIVSACVAAGALAIWASPSYGDTLRSWDFAARSAALLAPGVPNIPSRFLLTPSIQPLGPRGSAFEGVDPDATVNGVWFPLNDPNQYGVVGATLMLGEMNPGRYAGWLRAADVNAVLPRPYLAANPLGSSALSAGEKLQAARYFPPHVPAGAWHERAAPFVEIRAALPIVRDPFTAHFRDGFLLARDVISDPHDPATAPDTQAAASFVARTAWNPAASWVNGMYWWWLDPQIAFWPRSIVTWSQRPFVVPAAYRRGYVHLIVFAGRMYADEKPIPAKDGVATWYALDGATTLKVRGGAAVLTDFARIERPFAPVRTASRDSVAEQVPFSLDCMCTSMQLPAGERWVVLKQSYDDGWRLNVARGTVLRHVLFSGYGNAWHVRAPQGSRVFLSYAPAPIWQALVTWSLILWVILALGSAILICRQ